MILGRVAIEFLGFQGLRARGSEERLASDRLNVPLVFPILSDAPAVDAGSAANAPEYDLLGNPRDSQPDVGAYEVQLDP